MKNTGKTPYEIRLELLQLAFSVLENQHRARAEKEMGKVNAPYPRITSSPTTEDVIAEAEKMNNFISSSSNSN
jgi:hypothetical protein